MVNGYHVSLRRHRSVERNSSFCHFCGVLYLVSTEFPEETDVDVEQNFLDMSDIELPVQCGGEFCVICNELAMEQR